MRILFRFLFALLCLIIGGVTFLLVASPVDMLRDKVIEAVKRETGRDLAISGAASLKFFPSLALSFGDVALFDPAEMGDGTVVRMERLDLAVRLWPLLSRQLAVDELVLVRPEFDLRQDAEGRRNWDIARTKTRHGSLHRAPMRSRTRQSSVLTVALEYSQRPDA